MTEDLLILGELIAEQAAHMDAAEHRLLTNIREFDRLEGWASAASCAHWLSWRVGWTLGTAREHVRVAKMLGSLPHIDEALRVGKVSYCKVRAMTRVATPANEQVLLMDAQLTTGSQLERVCRKYRQLRRIVDGVTPADDDRDRFLRRRDLDNGMVSIEAVCRPEEAALIWAAIEQATKELFAARRAEERANSNAEEFAASNAEPESADVSAETSPGAAGDESADVSAETSPGAAGDESADVFAETCQGAAGDESADVFAETCQGAAGDESADVSAETCLDAMRDGSGESSAGTECAGTVVEHEGAEAHEGVDAFEGADAFECADELDPAQVYEDDCAFFERFGVCPERQPEPVSRVRDEDDDSIPAVRSAMTTTATLPVRTPTKAPRSTAIAKSIPKAAARAQFNRLDGLLALMRKVATGESSKKPVEIVVTVSAEALAKRAAPQECIAFLDDDGCISAETARRLSCDAGIVCMVEDDHGNPLSVGRRTRSIPASIGRALVKRDKCCRFPGCTNKVYLDGHHLEHWALGGETALYNLVLLCERHHTFVHEYGYRVEMDATGQPVFFDPQGRPAKDIPTRLLRDDLGWEHILGANQGLGIEPHVCGWNGEPVPYNEVCRALYRVDEGLLKPEDIC